MTHATLKNLSAVLLEPPYKIVCALCDIYDEASMLSDTSDLNADDLANTIVSMFTISDKIVDLLSQLMKREVDNTVDETTLFRRNCMTTKLLTIYARRNGREYLARTLKPVLGRIPGFEISDYELDKNRNSALTNEKLQENVKNAIKICKSCVDAIVDSESVFPRGLRSICNALHEQVKDRFPNSQYSCIGGLIFLRFICPAVISPELFGLLPENALTPKHRRILVLISKILQNISNKIVTSAKEAFMQTMNTFVSEAIPVVVQFFKDVTRVGTLVEEIVPRETDYSEFADRLFVYLKTNILTLGEALITGLASCKKIAEQIESEKFGYLHKYGENVVTDAWRKRWFILRGTQLHYFKDIQDSHAAGLIPLSDASVTLIKEEFIFEIETPYRSYRLKGVSALDAVSWFKAIEHVIQTKSLAPQGRNKSFTQSVMIPKTTISRSFTSFDKNTNITKQKWVKPTISKNRSDDEKSPRGNRATSPLQSKSFRSSDGMQSLRVKIPQQVTVPSRIQSQQLPPTGKLLLPSEQKVNAAPLRGGRGSRGTRGGHVTSRGTRGRPGSPRGGRGSRGVSRGSRRVTGKKEVLQGSPVQFRPVLSQPQKPPPATPFSGPPTDKAPTLTTPTVPQWNRITKTKSIDKGDSNPNRQLLQSKSHRTSSGAPEFSGTLRRRNFELHSWTPFKFEIISRDLIQYHPVTEGKMDNIPLIGTSITELRTGSPNCFELLRGSRKIILNALSSSECGHWISHLQEASMKKDVIRCSTMNLRESPSLVIPVWCELSEYEVIIYKILPDLNEWFCTLKVAEVVARVLDTKDGFALDDSVNAVTLLTESVEIKAWTTEIKCSKLNYWKQKKEQNPKEGGTPANSASPQSRQTGLFRTVSSKPLSGPPLEEITPMASESGFLLKIEKDRKTWTRLWTVLYKGSLWSYKVDLSNRPISEIPLTGIQVKTFDVESDDFQFELFSHSNPENSVLFEASDLIDLNNWMSVIKKQILKSAPAGSKGRVSLPSSMYTPKEDLKISHVGFLSKMNGTQMKTYWFTVENHQMTWYHGKQDKIPVQSISLHFSTVTALPDYFIEVYEPSSAQKIIVQVPTQAEEEESNQLYGTWIQTLHNAKSEYWKTNSIIQYDNQQIMYKHFTNRGYLLRMEGKRWIRRWFIIIKNSFMTFKNPKEPHPLSEFHLQSNSEIDVIESKENRLRFEISTDDRSIRLESCSTKNLALWLYSLRTAKSIFYGSSCKSEDPSDSDLELALRNPQREGFLMKQGLTRKNWKRRWFVLHYPALYYFSSSLISPGEQAGMIPLQDAQVVVRVQDTTFTRSVQFQIETKQRIYFLRADKEEDMLDWVEQISRSALGIDTTSKMKLDNSTVKRERVSSNNTNRDDGYLIKKGRTNKVWKKRWFTLAPGVLTYYKSYGDNQPAGVIILNDDCSVSIADESIKRKFCFVLSTRYRNYFLQAADQYEMVSWIETLKYYSNSPKKDATQNTQYTLLKLFNNLNQILASYDKSKQNLV